MEEKLGYMLTIILNVGLNFIKIEEQFIMVDGTDKMVTREVTTCACGVE
jgi:uncharacterized protein YchJ